jgi:hypothetical protein
MKSDVHIETTICSDCQVNKAECTSLDEEYLETIAASVALKYNLIYHQSEAICTNTDEQLEDLKKAREEIGKHMKVKPIRRSGSGDDRYFFVFNSLESPLRREVIKIITDEK